MLNSTPVAPSSKPINGVNNTVSNGIHKGTANASANSIEKKTEPYILYEQVTVKSSDPVNTAILSSVSARPTPAPQQQQQQDEEVIKPVIKPAEPSTPVIVVEQTPPPPKPTPSVEPIFRKPTQTSASSTTPIQNRNAKTKSVYYQSKYKYINGKVSHKSEHITNIRNLSTMWPAECNGFQVNKTRAAFLLAGTSGQISVVELSRAGRLTDSVINSIINKSKVSDFSWDPFDDQRLAVACDEGVVKVWQLPVDGLNQSLEEPYIQLKGHIERLYCIKYHPYVKDVLASASYDRTIRIWNVETGVAVVTLVAHTDVVSS